MWRVVRVVEGAALENSAALWKQEIPHPLKLLGIRYGSDIGFQCFLSCFSLLFPAGNQRDLSKSIYMESCPSGRRYSTRNAARSQILPGFKSLTLRHRALQRHSAGLFLRLLSGRRKVENRLHCVCGSQLRLVFQVGVEIRCCGEITVSQPLLNHLHGNAVGKQKTGTAVSEVVETDVAELVLAQNPLKPLIQVVGRKTLADLVHADVVKVVLAV